MNWLAKLGRGIAARILSPSSDAELQILLREK